MGLEELYAELKDLEENGDREKDDVEGFVAVLDEMSEEERERWHREVAPVKSALYKTRKISYKIINSPTLLLPRWREQLAGTDFAQHTLLRDVATRWNSTHDMLLSFLKMKEHVMQFIDRSSNGLAEYILTDEEWEVISGLVSALTYYALTDDSDLYRMAMILHPKYKLDYFRKARWEQEWIDTAVRVTREAWERDFKPSDDDEESSSDTVHSDCVSFCF
ncbi:hypothetical protein F5878DRAFT_548248 [Lentinula raphanica]|uniref:Uncharacterized protein n=1 Tax=Lentinula raphanica TaxID=153919 RepID=A0AA38U4V1_9AGAR|nr:hypothetical protein F5878DRAFT_548248 [Lentinula raphanica]